MSNIKWETVPIDTKILIRILDGDYTISGHFSHYSSETDIVFYFKHGKTSWTSDSNEVIGMKSKNCTLLDTEV